MKTYPLRSALDHILQQSSCHCNNSVDIYKQADSQNVCSNCSSVLNTFNNHGNHIDIPLQVMSSLHSQLYPSQPFEQLHVPSLAHLPLPEHKEVAFTSSLYEAGQVQYLPVQPVLHRQVSPLQAPSKQLAPIRHAV